MPILVHLERTFADTINVINRGFCYLYTCIPYRVPFLYCIYGEEFRHIVFGEIVQLDEINFHSTKKVAVSSILYGAAFNMAPMILK